VSQWTTAREQRESRERLVRDESGKRGGSSSPSSLFSAASSAPDDNTIERTVCWDLQQRGDAGETALHLCLLFSIKQSKFRDIAIALLNAFPKLSLDYYELEEYYGKLFKQYVR